MRVRGRAMVSPSKQVEIYTGRRRTASEPHRDPSDDVDEFMDWVGKTEGRRLLDDE